MPNNLSPEVKQILDQIIADGDKMMVDALQTLHDAFEKYPAPVIPKRLF